MNANCIHEDAPRIRRNVPCLLVAGTKEERERKIKGQKLDHFLWVSVEMSSHPPDHP